MDDDAPSGHRSHKAPKSVRRLLQRIGFKAPRSSDAERDD